MKTDLQTQVADPELDDAFRKHDHDEHQGDDGPPKEEKSVKKAEDIKRLKVYKMILDDETPELIEEFQNVDKCVPTIFDHEKMEATLRDMMSNMFKDVEEYAYHLEQSKNYMENQTYGNSEERKYVLSFHKIRDVPFLEEDLEEKMNRWVYKYNHNRVRNNPEEYFSDHRIVKVVRVTIEQQYELDYMEQIIVMRENDKPDSFSEADFKYLNKDDIEDMSRLIWERVHDFQLGIESYQIKINLTAPTLIFPGIEAFLKEVKLKIFETEFLKKVPLLGELDHDIMKACKREITKHLRHHEQMRRWESFVNGRPILPMMRRQLVVTTLPENSILAHKESDGDKYLLNITIKSWYLKLEPGNSIEFFKSKYGFKVISFSDSDWQSVL
ncbi:hypothetical protein Tco_1121488 [Tanacetum coccineum]|uniref:DUF38 domain-containing protein n=1 Tax=Tanacetum coccineum TaxID=301880 RepID=A0ABQ5J0S5_9ASTR